MARRKAPKRRRQGASNGSWGKQANQQLAEDAAGTSRCQSRTLLAKVQLEMPLLPSTASSATQGPAKATGTAGMVFSLAGQLTGALVSLWKSLLSTCIFAMYVPPVSAVAVGHKMPLQKKTILKGLFLWLPVALGAGTWVGSTAEDPEEGPETAPDVYAGMEDWALKSSGAVIDLQRTSKTYDCKEPWFCRALRLFRKVKPPDTILQPDVSPGNCWALQGHQGQVVIRLPARIHLTAITVQHIYKEISPSGTVISAPKDMAVFGVDADGEEETLLGTFMYDVEREASQTFPLKNVPFPRAFSYIKLLVKSNWGNPAYTCIYRVQVHGKMAEPESLH
ncbi:SUN domain-containing protein 5-like [Chlamydotis macqueenii]